MKKIPKITLTLSANILDTQHITQSETSYEIPLKRTRDNNKYYDDTYSLLARAASFHVDMEYSKLVLCVELNPINQYRFYLCADYKEFNMKDVTDEQLERFSIKQEVSLSDEEILNIRYVIREFCVA